MLKEILCSKPEYTKAQFCTFPTPATCTLGQCYRKLCNCGFQVVCLETILLEGKCSQPTISQLPRYVHGLNSHFVKRMFKLTIRSPDHQVAEPSRNYSRNLG